LSQLLGELDGQLNQWRNPDSKLQLATVAPKLLSIRDCILTVPGMTAKLFERNGADVL